ncbi:PHP domain-containing protein [Aneurinibacillus sp. Ricciae_BoGa-3]|uniref:PHP domain-containing protein n=1 Tax=Aneurinibacillus sp. Ricciae_BoGa-3 TaxID=3022697 RepID=UPI00233FF853|nr:PHP domain-containing protein [Aneurinibacillus sp. Ricciae_BoGa-3]WCK53131.1 PHP domain-containing protein [Aneurinibacillus sp. Ricciae_BoGa-3]
MKRVDLHSHTTASDGTFTPEQSIARALANGLSAFAITDHDTVAAFPHAIEEGEKYNVEIVPGIEISSVYEGKDVHVLGYYMDYTDEKFLNRVEELRNVRNTRNQMIVDKLVSLGIPITMDEVRSRRTDKNGNIGRPHIAQVLVDKGVVASTQEAFDKYLSTSGAAYTNPPRITPAEAVQLILDAGGVPVLAHPGLYKNVELARELIGVGLKGIEVFHPDHGPEDEATYGSLADEYGLIKTGGSDFHGIRNGKVFHGDLGEKSVPKQTLNRIKELAGK